MIYLLHSRKLINNDGSLVQNLNSKRSLNGKDFKEQVMAVKKFCMFKFNVNPTIERG